jgi:putative NADH-flavin reductase
MARITVIGGTGYTGAAIVAEAAKRGHAVTAVSRSVPEPALEGVNYVQGSALNPEILTQAIDGADAVVVATAARGDMVEGQALLTQAVAHAAAESGARLIAVGGFSVLRPAPGAARFVEGEIPEAYRVEAHAGYALLQLLESSPESLDYVFVSPAAKFGAWVPGDVTGTYTLGTDVAQMDENGSSQISAPDFALAIVDLIESGEHRRGHVSVVS